MKAIAVLMFAILLVGCGPTPGAQDVSGSQGSGEVKLIVLDDGTRCAVLIGFYKGALSCDWGKK